MRFHLQIKITGLCMIVPAADGKTVHVLLPKSDDQGSGGHAGHRIPAHKASLEYRGKNPSLKGWTLDLSHLEGGLQTTLPEGIVNLSDPRLANTKIDLNAVSSQLAGRVILSAGCFTHRDGLALWDFPQHPPVYLANWVTWSVPNIPGRSLELKRAELDGSGSRPFESVPVPTGKTLRMHVRHLPPGDPGTHGNPGPQPLPGGAPGHFHGFFRLFSTQINEARATPGFIRRGWGLSHDIPGSCIANPNKHRGWMFGHGRKRLAGRTYNCIVIGGQG